MREIEFSSMIASSLLMLDDFEKRTLIHARHRPLDWTTGWNHILQIALYQKGPDISEVGSTWLENLDSMRALRPFTRQQMSSLGESDFLPTAWPPEEETTRRDRISIPWTLDTRMVHYRRSALKKANVQEEGAFATPEAFHHTLECLRSAGYEQPLVMPTGGLSFHNMASWVWGRGGRFRSADYRRVTLVEPEAQQGLVEFFSLYKYMDSATSGFTYSDADNWYFAGRAPVLFSGQWVANQLNYTLPNILPEVKDDTWHAVPPGTPYVGSTHLVTWRHSLNDAENLELIRHLTSADVLLSIYRSVGVFSPREDVLTQPPFSTDARSRVVIECLRKGRQFRSGKLWAGVEMRLSDLANKLWSDLLEQPGLDVKAEVEKRIGDLAKRLEKTLLAN